MYNFNAAQQTENLIKWIKDWLMKMEKAVMPYWAFQVARTAQ